MISCLWTAVQLPVRALTVIDCKLFKNNHSVVLSSVDIVRPSLAPRRLDFSAWDKKEPCTPPVLTCRWLREITQAFHMIEPNIPAVIGCPENVKEAWEGYLANHRVNLMNSSMCKGVLFYDIDYRDIIGDDRLPTCAHSEPLTHDDSNMVTTTPSSPTSSSPPYSPYREPWYDTESDADPEGPLMKKPKVEVVDLTLSDVEDTRTVVVPSVTISSSNGLILPSNGIITSNAAGQLVVKQAHDLVLNQAHDVLLKQAHEVIRNSLTQCLRDIRY